MSNAESPSKTILEEMLKTKTEDLISKTEEVKKKATLFYLQMMH